MSEEDLEVLITLDDPGEDDLEEDNFHHRKDEEYSQPSAARSGHDQRTEVIVANDSFKVAG